MVGILQMTFSNAFTWQKIYVFWLKFCQCFPKGPVYNKSALVKVKVWQHANAITWFNDHPVYWQIYALPGHKELKSSVGRCPDLIAWVSSIRKPSMLNNNKEKRNRSMIFPWCISVLWREMLFIFNSLWPGDAIWRQRSCQDLLWHPVISHYVNQCWLFASSVLNTLRPRQNGRHFIDIFKCIFLNENVWILIKISLKCIPNVRIINIQHLFRSWLGADQAPSHYLNQWWLVRLPTHICVTRPQCVSKLQWNLNQNRNIFIQENAFEFVICIMVINLHRTQCVENILGNDLNSFAETTTKNRPEHDWLPDWLQTHRSHRSWWHDDKWFTCRCKLLCPGRCYINF